MSAFKFSLSKDAVHYKTFETTEIQDLSDAILEYNWSIGTYKDSYRNLDNFLEANLIGLDIDGGLTLEEALETFKDYKHIIATTRSHQKEKKGIICDRFRVVLFLDKPITDQRTFGATWHSLYNSFPFIDPACKDASRFFYPSNEIISVNEEGLLVIPVDPGPELPKEKPKALTKDQRGKLSRSTLEFLVQGADEHWNIKLFKAAKDFYEQGYEQEDFTARAEQIEGFLDHSSLRTIESAFSKEPKYGPRIEDKQSTDLPGEARSLVVTSASLFNDTFNYLSDKELVKGEPTGLEGLDKLLIGKRLGEVTALCAEGKTGKNALYHYLMHLWMSKENPTPMGYASRELDPATEVIPDYLSMAFGENARLVEMTDQRRADYQAKLTQLPIYFAKGRGYFPREDLKRWMGELQEKHNVHYFWFDHLHWMLLDPEDYKAASLLSRDIKDLAMSMNVHVDIIIQPKILQDGQKPSLNSMKGGSAIGQNIDNLLTLERVQGQRNISKLNLKAKRSRLAEIGEVHLQYDSQTLLFEEVVPKFDNPEDDSSNVYQFDTNRKILS